MESKFNFYEIVKVVSLKATLRKVNGKVGVITGKSQSEEDPAVFAYAVTILSEGGLPNDGWFIFEEDLQPTGKKADPKDFLTGESMKVEVDPNTGHGRIIDPKRCVFR